MFKICNILVDLILVKNISDQQYLGLSRVWIQLYHAHNTIIHTKFPYWYIWTLTCTSPEVRKYFKAWCLFHCASLLRGTSSKLVPVVMVALWSRQMFNRKENWNHKLTFNRTLNAIIFLLKHGFLKHADRASCWTLSGRYCLTQSWEHFSPDSILPLRHLSGTCTAFGV